MKQILKNISFGITTAAVTGAALFFGIDRGTPLMAQETETTEAKQTDTPHQETTSEPTSKTSKPSQETADKHTDNSGLLDVKMKSITGEEVDLSQYKGKVVVVVNTASKCGFTRQYKQLEEIHQAHHENGLVVLGFPCNQFRGQEPGSEEEIAKFCRVKYGVTFDLFAKSDVNGKHRNKLYQSLCALDLQPKGKGNVSWNFEKFVIARDGTPIGRFSSRVSPTDDEFVSLLKTELAKKVDIAPQMTPPTGSPAE